MSSLIIKVQGKINILLGSWRKIYQHNDTDHTGTIYSVSVTAALPSDNVDFRLATACGDNAIRVYNVSVDTHEDALDTGDASYSYQKENVSVVCACLMENAHDQVDVNYVEWHPKQPNTLLSAGDDGLVNIWQLE